MRGKCLCGAIEFTADEKPGQVVNCHCSSCRRAHGAAFASIAFADRASLEVLKGEDVLKEYESTVGVRAFCSNCGSRLMNYGKDGADFLGVHIACLDDSYAGRPQAHCFTGSKAPWHEPSTDIPSFEEYPSL